MDREEGERLTKGVEGRRRRQQMKWEDCMKGDLSGRGMEKKSEGSGEWQQVQ